MLETFRKHHYILMLLIAIVVVISFTFLSKPYDRTGRGGEGQRIFTLYNEDVTVSEVQNIDQEMRIAGQLAGLSQDRQDRDTDPVSVFVQQMSNLDNKESPTDRTSIDLDPPKNILVTRHECEKLGIEVEREDLEKFIKEIGAFKSNGGFDAKKLEDFLNSGLHGDRAATETKLFTSLRDVMRFQRLVQLVGGTFPPSKAEVDADYAEKNQKITAATLVLLKKVFEDQAVADDEIQKFYDGEKAKADAPKPAADPKKSVALPLAPPPPAADPIVLSDEKRTVKYLVTEQAKPPVAPPPLQPLPPQEDVSKLPDDQKKAKEEEYKKKQEEFKKKEEEYNKANEEYQKKVTDHNTAKTTWLKSVDDLSNALVSEDRGAKTFEDVAKPLNFEVKTATFTKAALPEDIKKINPGAGGGAADVIFAAPKGGPEEYLEDQGKTAYCFFSVTEIEKAAVLPLDQVKQKISDKLKAEKVTAALKAAGESARSNMLEALKGGKPFKEAVELTRSKMLEALKKEKFFKEADAAVVLTSTEVPAFTKGKPPAGANSSIVSKQAETLNAGDLSPAESVPDGLLLVYVEKKELPKHPDMEQQKKDLTKNHTFHDAAASLGAFNQANMQEMMDKYEYLGKRGGFTNPVLKAWFTERRNAAESVTD